jgi:hypothetical protein
LSSLGLGVAGGSILGILLAFDFSFDVFGMPFNSLTNHAYFQVLLVLANFLLVQRGFVDQTRTRGKSESRVET